MYSSGTVVEAFLQFCHALIKGTLVDNPFKDRSLLWQEWESGVL